MYNSRMGFFEAIRGNRDFRLTTPKEHAGLRNSVRKNFLAEDEPGILKRTWNKLEDVKSGQEEKRRTRRALKKLRTFDPNSYPHIEDPTPLPTITRKERIEFRKQVDEIVRKAERKSST